MARVHNETPLTALQADVMRDLCNHVGKTVDVQTSIYDFQGNGVAKFPPTWKPVATSKMTTLRGLERRGRIRIIDSFWQGARVEVL